MEDDGPVAILIIRVHRGRQFLARVTWLTDIEDGGTETVVPGRSCREVEVLVRRWLGLIGAGGPGPSP